MRVLAKAYRLRAAARRELGRGDPLAARRLAERALQLHTTEYGVDLLAQAAAMNQESGQDPHVPSECRASTTTAART